jgi:hypothetical protein
MGGGSQIGSPLLDFDFDIDTVIRLSMGWLYCVSRLSPECGMSFCNCGHILASR